MGILKTILFIHLLFSGWCFLFLTYLKFFYKVDITKNLFYLFDVTLSSKLISKSKIYGTDNIFTIFWWSIIPGKNVKLLLVYLILAFSTEEGFFLELLKDGNKKALGPKYDEAVLRHHQIKKKREKKSGCVQEES